MPDELVVAFDALPGTDDARPDGAVWGHAGSQLNATVLAWPAGHVVAEHVNVEREVLLVVVAGSGVVVVDGSRQAVRPGTLVVLPRGARREIQAGTDGLVYVSTHQARGPLQVTRRSSPPPP